MAQLPEHFHPSSGDSAGQSWAGRSFEPNPFANDDGTTPPEVSSAVERFRSGDGDDIAVIDALRESRVLIPLIAEIGETGVNEQGVTVDKSADLSIVTVAGPDGRSVMPVFTSTDALRAWNADARPVPAAFRSAAVAAADEGTDLIIVDPGSAGEFGLRRPAVWAVAKGEAWTPGHQNPGVASALGEAVAHEDDIRRMEVAPASEPGSLAGPELRVALVFRAGASEEDVRAAVARVNGTWSSSRTVVETVDSLAVVVASEPSEGAPTTGDDASGQRESPKRGLRGWLSRRKR